MNLSRVASAIVLLSAVPTAAAEERCVPPAARIVSLQGSVDIQPASEGAWRALSLEESVCVGDVIRVGPFARAALALADDSVLRLDERTMLRIDQVAVDQPTLLDLIFGAVNFFSRQPRVLRVDTPYVNGGAEGTEFVVRVTEDGTLITLFEGRVRAANALGELVLGPGDSALTLAGKAPQPEIVARPRDAVAWALYYPPVLPPLAEGRAGERPLPPGVRAAIDAVAVNDYAPAIAALDAVPEAARDARYFTYRAGVLLNVGRVEAAAAAIESALALDPEAGEALAERAIIRVVQNRRDEALADARRAVELSPDSAAAQVALSYALQASFQLEQARDVLREASMRLPDDALLWARLAEIELSFGELDRAEQAAERAVALAPDLARTQMVLGFANLTRIEIDDAKAAFRRAIELDSAEPLARLGLGLAIIRAGDLDAGRAELEIAAGLDPNASLLRSYLGKAYYEERRDPLAADQYAIAKELDPNDPTPWFYDAIQLQTQNRPVEALRSLETSIALNDNRAPYRSRLLLDEDLATREVSLARIYDDLGYEQLGLLEASSSLDADPANYSAHRFLSDTYAGLPRHEVARASELLQAQLLQPININPSQPTAQISNLNVILGALRPSTSLSDFDSLFERNRAQLETQVFAGNNSSFGDEAIASAVQDDLSFSVGQFHSQTDGFRENDDITNNVVDLFGQWSAAPGLSLNAGYRYRDTDQGDLELTFDDAFSPESRTELSQKTLRTGGSLSQPELGTFVWSAVFTDLAEQTLIPEAGNFKIDRDQRGYRMEAAYLGNHDWFSVVTGIGASNVDQEIKAKFGPFLAAKQSDNVDQLNAFGYLRLDWPESMVWTVGASIDDYEEGSFTKTQLNPKLGLSWQILPRLTLRGAVLRTLAPAQSLNQTIEPTTVAGFNQFFDDFQGTEAWQYSAGFDSRLTDDLSIGLSYQYRNLKGPINALGEGIETVNQNEKFLATYLYWTVTDRWVFRIGVDYEDFVQRETDLAQQRKMETWVAPVAVRYFDPAGGFAELRSSIVWQEVELENENLGDEQFVNLDVVVGYRLPKRSGAISLEMLNALDKNFRYQDVNFRTRETVQPRFVPDRTILARLTLRF